MASAWEMGWDAVGAIATTGATVVALWASWQAIRAPEKARLSDQLDATKQVLRSAEEALAVQAALARLVESRIASDDAVIELRAHASHVAATLERLIARPTLRDDAIATGAGAMAIAEAIATVSTLEEARSNRRITGEPTKDIASLFTTTNRDKLLEIVARTHVIAKTVRERAEQVRLHHRISHADLETQSAL